MPPLADYLARHPRADYLAQRAVPHAPAYCAWCVAFGLAHRPGAPRYCCACAAYHEAA